MKINFYLLIAVGTFNLNFAQEQLPDKAKMLKSSSESICKCIDSINYVKNDKKKNIELANECIDKQVLVYQMTKKYSEALESKKSDQKQINVEVNSNKNSNDYKDSFYDLQRQTFDNCKSLKALLMQVEDDTKTGSSENSAAIKFYNSGIKESNQEHWTEALNFFEKAVKEDPNFASAWDNIGLCNRRLNQLDNAVDAYKKSLKIDPLGKMSLQNLPVALSKQQKYQEAIDAYKDFDSKYPGDVEVYYGIGQIYYEYLKEYEKSLEYMCKAFNLYTAQKSPYRTDAETIIVYIYKKMKDAGNLDKFNEILKKNNISPIEG